MDQGQAVDVAPPAALSAPDPQPPAATLIVVLSGAGQRIAESGARGLAARFTEEGGSARESLLTIDPAGGLDVGLVHRLELRRTGSPALDIVEFPWVAAAGHPEGIRAFVLAAFRLALLLVTAGRDIFNDLKGTQHATTVADRFASWGVITALSIIRWLLVGPILMLDFAVMVVLGALAIDTGLVAGRAGAPVRDIVLMAYGALIIGVGVIGIQQYRQKVRVRFGGWIAATLAVSIVVVVVCLWGRGVYIDQALAEVLTVGVFYPFRVLYLTVIALLMVVGAGLAWLGTLRRSMARPAAVVALAAGFGTATFAALAGCLFAAVGGAILALGKPFDWENGQGPIDCWNARGDWTLGGCPVPPDGPADWATKLFGLSLAPLVEITTIFLIGTFLVILALAVRAWRKVSPPAAAQSRLLDVTLASMAFVPVLLLGMVVPFPSEPLHSRWGHVAVIAAGLVIVAAAFGAIRLWRRLAVLTRDDVTVVLGLFDKGRGAAFAGLALFVSGVAGVAAWSSHTLAGEIAASAILPASVVGALLALRRIPSTPGGHPGGSGSSGGLVAVCIAAVDAAVSATMRFTPLADGLAGPGREAVIWTVTAASIVAIVWLMHAETRRSRGGLRMREQVCYVLSAMLVAAAVIISVVPLPAGVGNDDSPPGVAALAVRIGPPDGATQPKVAALLSALVGGFVWVLFFVARKVNLTREAVTADAPAPAGMASVLDRGLDFVRCLNLRGPSGDPPELQALTCALGRFVTRLVAAPPQDERAGGTYGRVVIVSEGLGSLIAMEYLRETHPGIPVDLVTLGSPARGVLSGLLPWQYGWVDRPPDGPPHAVALRIERWRDAACVDDYFAAPLIGTAATEAAARIDIGTPGRGYLPNPSVVAAIAGLAGWPAPATTAGHSASPSLP